MRVGSLFSGIGGLELGLERAGMQVVWQVEVDDYATKVLAKHWPHVARYGDVRECGAHNLAPVDLVCGGFPCRDTSTAGRQAGLDGEHSTLWAEFARIIREIRPRWALVENTPGLLHSSDGRFFGQVLGDLASCGYDAWWDCIPAALFGAPHIRYRVFILAYAQNEGARRWGLGKGLCQERRQLGQPWRDKSPIHRMVDGLPNRVHRLRCTGNAVVPQIAEWLGRSIMEAEHAS